MYARLMQALVPPRVELVDHAPGLPEVVGDTRVDFEARCYLPDFEPGVTPIELDVVAEPVRSRPGPAIGRGRVAPLAVAPLWQDGRIAGLRVAFRHQLPDELYIYAMDYTARLRYETQEGHAMPGPLAEETGGARREPVGPAFDTSAPGWVYDQLIMQGKR